MHSTASNSAAREALQARVIGDAAGAIDLLMAWLGDRTGAHRALAAREPGHRKPFRGAAGVDARYVHEWLASGAAAGGDRFAAARDAFHPAPERAAPRSDHGNPARMP